MGGEELWKIFCKTVENFRILVLFPSFNAYETVEDFQTLRKACSFVTRSWRDDEKIFLFHYRVQHLSCWREDLIPSCHLYYRIIACGKVFKMLDCFFWCLLMMMLNYLPFFCFNDIIFPVKTKSFQTIIQGFWNYLFSLVWFANVDSLFSCFVGGFASRQDVNHNNNRRGYGRMPLSVILV